MLVMAGKLSAAQKKIEELCKLGKLVTFSKSGGKMTDDENTDSVSLYAFPVRFSPFSRKVMNQISWAEDCSVILYVSKKEADAKGLTENQIKNKNTISFNNQDHEIVNAQPYKNFEDDFLYIAVGAK